MAELSDLAGIGRRSATAVLSRAAQGSPWRGHLLEVRTVNGRGGRSGLSYEVSLRSLSEALGGPLEPAPAPPPRDIARGQADTRRKRLAAILPFADLEPASADRARAAERQAELTGVPLRTLHRWAGLYAEHGFNGLAREKPSNAGERRVHVSRTFDTAFRTAGHPAELLAEIAAETERFIKGLWKSRREASRLGGHRA